MTISIDLMQLLLSLLVLAGVVLLVYATVFLAQTLKVVRQLRKLLAENEENINGTLQSMPGIAGNVESITLDVRQGVDTLSDTAEGLEDRLLGARSNTMEKAENVIETVYIVAQLVRNAMDYFEDRKR